MFGPHLILEGYKCSNTEALSSEDTLKQVLTDLPALMNMTVIMPPRTMYYDCPEMPEDQGVSAFVIIAESHLAIHTFPAKGFFTLDIFSCKEFNVQIAIDYIVEMFAPASYEHKVLERGREFPRCLDRSEQIVLTEA